MKALIPLLLLFLAGCVPDFEKRQAEVESEVVSVTNSLGTIIDAKYDPSYRGRNAWLIRTSKGLVIYVDNYQMTTVQVGKEAYEVQQEWRGSRWRCFTWEGWPDSYRY